MSSYRSLSKSPGYSFGKSSFLIVVPSPFFFKMCGSPPILPYPLHFPFIYKRLILLKMAPCCLFWKYCYPQTHGESNPTLHLCFFLENHFFYMQAIIYRKFVRVHVVLGYNLFFPSRCKQYPFSSMYVRLSMCGLKFCMDSPLHNHQDPM